MKIKKVNKNFRTSIETPFVFLGLLLAFVKLLDGIVALKKWIKKS